MELETRLCYRTIRVKLNGNWWSRQGECTTFTADPAWFLKQISKHLIEINNFIWQNTSMLRSILVLLQVNTFHAKCLQNNQISNCSCWVKFITRAYDLIRTSLRDYRKFGKASYCSLVSFFTCGSTLSHFECPMKKDSSNFSVILNFHGDVIRCRKYVQI